MNNEKIERSLLPVARDLNSLLSMCIGRDDNFTKEVRRRVEYIRYNLRFVMKSIEYKNKDN